MTVAEYLAFERASKEKHTYVRGEIFAMAGASVRHNALVLNLGALLRDALRGTCRAFPSDLRTWVPALETFTYPDVSVICGELKFYDGADVDTVTNPRVLIEVLSDSTEAYDRGETAEGYRQMPSVTDHLLVAQHKPHVEHYARQQDGSWLLREAGSGGVIAIVSIDALLPIDAIYRDVMSLPARAGG